ncbi:MSMEG_0570 family nitrogen starvation response protein [Marmoricola endophyticus]|nr:MSMEG_0570 family nitrogen starvation response protein [Marmoricola endophyticus]
MTFTVRWPDGVVEECYSPSLVVHEHLEAGTDYRVEEFSRRATYALSIAGDRVQEIFGFACTSAISTTEQIQTRAAAYAPDEVVRVLGMHDGESRARPEQRA